MWVVVIVRAAQGVSLMVSGYAIVRGADGIPLETYPAEAAQAIVSVWVVSGLSRLILFLLSAVVLVRYRSATTLLAILLTLDQVGRLIVFHFYPLVRVGNPIGPKVNLALLALTILGLALSLWKRENGAEAADRK